MRSVDYTYLPFFRRLLSGFHKSQIFVYNLKHPELNDLGLARKGRVRIHVGTFLLSSPGLIDIRVYS